MSNELTRIGVFYDGNYFLHVSNYYNYQHERKARISISGLHDMIKELVAENEGKSFRHCQIVDSHYFRGRLNAVDAQRTNKLYPDRLFDDVLMSEGVTTHYLPIRNKGGKREEKGIDVWLALEAYDQAISKNFDVLVLIASDGDYLSLVRKINALGTRAMILAWDLQYTDNNGRNIITRTSQDLLEEVTYPVPMHDMIDGNDRYEADDPIIESLFVNSNQQNDAGFQEQSGFDHLEEGDIEQSYTLNMNNGYGFIYKPPHNLFFHHLDVEGEFNEIGEGDLVEYTIGRNEKGEYVGKRIRKIEEEH
jgi:uncharacterized LabA/DUF88 family protein/cold shock CspA family protein